MQIAMTDEDVVQKAADLMGATTIIARRERPDKRKHPKPMFVARVHGYQAARVMQMVLPHMGKRRSAEILSALQKWNERPVKYRETGLPPACHPDRPIAQRAYARLATLGISISSVRPQSGECPLGG